MTALMAMATATATAATTTVTAMATDMGATDHVVLAV